MNVEGEISHLWVVTVTFASDCTWLGEVSGVMPLIFSLKKKKHTIIDAIYFIN